MEVKRSDPDGSLVLLKLLSGSFGTASVTSQSNDNTRFRIDLKAAGPFAPGDDKGLLALVIDNFCVMAGSHSDPDETQHMDLSAWQVNKQAANAFAAKLGVTPKLRFYYGKDSSQIDTNPADVWTGKLESNEITVNIVSSKGPWGKPTEQGLAIRLRDPMEGPVGLLQADLGNKGYVAWMALASRKLFELEVDGEKYVNSGENIVPDTRLEPGQIMSNISIPLKGGWLCSIITGTA